MAQRGTSGRAQSMSAFGGKADIIQTSLCLPLTQIGGEVRFCLRFFCLCRARCQKSDIAPGYGHRLKYEGSEELHARVMREIPMWEVVRSLVTMSLAKTKCAAFRSSLDRNTAHHLANTCTKSSCVHPGRSSKFNHYRWLGNILIVFNSEKYSD